MKRKTGKIIRAVFNTFIIILLSAVVFLTVSVIISGNKGYTPIFGNAYVSVQSRSMEGEKPAGNDEKPDGFNKGDIIKIKILDEEKKKNLSRGDIITFYMSIGGKTVLNSHRIIGVGASADGRTVFTTKGDNPAAGESVEAVYETDIVGVYTGRKFVGAGNAADFIRSTEGFFICVVLPSFAIVGYYVYNLIVAIKSNRTVKVNHSVSESEREELIKAIRKELMEELKSASEKEAGGG